MKKFFYMTDAAAGCRMTHPTGARSSAYGRKKRHLPMLFLTVGIMMLAAGCGKKETVETQAQTDSPSEQIEVLKPEQTNASKAQMEIDEETRRELTMQLLEENELDTSVTESGQSTRSCTFDLPEGFEEFEELPGMYVTGRYPIDASSIYYAAMDQDISLQLMTEETFKEQVQESLGQSYGEHIEVNIDSFENIKIDGYPAFRIMCHYQVGDIQIMQLQYAINADKSYMITYSQTGDYDRMEEYEASAATIHVE